MGGREGQKEGAMERKRQGGGWATARKLPARSSARMLPTRSRVRSTAVARVLVDPPDVFVEPRTLPGLRVEG